MAGIGRDRSDVAAANGREAAQFASGRTRPKFAGRARSVERQVWEVNRPRIATRIRTYLRDSGCAESSIPVIQHQRHQSSPLTLVNTALSQGANRA